ncbi:GNAT family N-acetyltransferase [Isobaculum melis]|uniref:Acetyltransferase (GNAT) family protein n=1 Tax=Isobaculum melis TaxID=142588 RepID=A0A1H9Q709_9LACT|nr:GNAT family N-acetyltransferase [Isobaculum melis]SER55915.1 Acetyltransferase (GNAT) family protein [Isobaculum melis]
MFTITKWNSKAYQEALVLRNELLKATSGKKQLVEAPLEEQNDLHLVVKCEQQVIGTLLLHPIDQKLIQVKQVAIDSAYQRHGIGKQLIQYAEQIASRLGFSVVFLTGRQQAWPFYEKLAYEMLAESYQEGQLVLKLFKKEVAIEKQFNPQREMKTNG